MVMEPKRPAATPAMAKQAQKAAMPLIESGGVELVGAAADGSVAFDDMAGGGGTGAAGAGASARHRRKGGREVRRELGSGRKAVGVVGRRGGYPVMDSLTE
jgi:hypothetical protein